MYGPRARDRQARATPFGQAAVEAMRAAAGLSQERDGLERQHAPGTPAVGDDVDARRQLIQSRLQLGERNVQRPRKMPVSKLVRRANVEQGDEAVRHPLFQRGEAHGLKGVARLEVVIDHGLDAVGMALADRAQGGGEVEDIVPGQAIDHLLAAALAGDQSHPAQGLQVLRGVGDGQVGLGRQGLDGLLALREVFEQVQTVGVAEPAGDLGEGGEEVELGGQGGSPVAA